MCAPFIGWLAWLAGKNAFSSGYNIVRLKLSNIAKNRNLQEVEVEESEPDRNISDSDSDW